MNKLKVAGEKLTNSFTKMAKATAPSREYAMNGLKNSATKIREKIARPDKIDATKELENLATKMRESIARKMDDRKLKNFKKSEENLAGNSKNSENSKDLLEEEIAVLKMKNANLTRENDELMRKMHNYISIQEHEKIVTDLTSQIDRLQMALERETAALMRLRPKASIVAKIKNIAGYPSKLLKTYLAAKTILWTYRYWAPLIATLAIWIVGK